jgi:hypothetical protein
LELCFYNSFKSISSNTFYTNSLINIIGEEEFNRMINIETQFENDQKRNKEIEQLNLLVSEHFDEAVLIIEQENSRRGGRIEPPVM